MSLFKDTTQWRRWGSTPRPLGLEFSTLPLSHCAPIKAVERLYQDQWQFNAATKFGAVYGKVIE